MTKEENTSNNKFVSYQGFTFDDVLLVPDRKSVV